MAPVPEEHTSIRKEFITLNETGGPILEDDRVVISGISGIFSEAHSVKEFSNILYNKINTVTSEQPRWDYKHPELTEYLGKAPGLDRFDSQFFTVPFRLGHFMDPMSRKMLEQTYQALYDAGLSPGHLSGKKVGVFIGSSYSDTENEGFVNTTSKFGLGIVGSSKTMFANRISYWLNIKGPSLAIDENDCSATTSLEQAYLALKRGECEAAIVGSAHLHLQYHSLIHHERLGLVAKDGKTKSFAENSDGYAFSDAISVFLLQKSKDALRAYVEIVHVKNEFISVLSDKTGPKYGYFRNPQIVSDFIKRFYEEIQITPQAVEYVEAYGTAVPDADKAELEAIERVYCESRTDPLLVGSVSSNIGLTESAAGMTAITKLILGYYTGKLAANMNCEKPRRDIAALCDQRMHIVTEHQAFDRRYTAVSGMSVTGVNSHVLLDGLYKRKDSSRYKSSIPRLVVLSGRQESSVTKIFDDLKSRSVDAEELALLYNIHSKDISGHLARGYIILDTDADKQTISLNEKVEHFDDAKRPLWFVYSGMGSQWAGMGAQLMRIPIFASAIERCDQVLKPRGLDIVNIITSNDSKIFNNILHCFVGIAAVQIGLTDILRELGLVPDGIIGHSVGELGCAYADGCLTAEEMILAAYSRGLVSLQTPLIRGSMAAVGLGYHQINTMCPSEIDVACHNSSESCTISGPADIMRDFVAELTAKEIFAKEVQCANIAYHSRYIADAAPNLLKYLKEVIKSPKPRSKRWLSTSVPQDKWDETSAKYCSAEYHTNNLLNPVLFEDTIQLIPSNAVLVEVAPHGLLQAILKRAMPAGCLSVSLTARGHLDNTLFLLKAIGDIYMAGYTLNLHNLYPKVQFPVSTETPMLSHLVEWVHSESWNVASYRCGIKQMTASCNFVKSVHDAEHSYLRGHIIREKMCYPFSAALLAVWDTLAMFLGAPKRKLSVNFHDLHLYTQPLLFDQRALKLFVSINKGTGLFEVSNENSKVMKGYIAAIVATHPEFKKLYNETNDTNNDMELTSEDIYQLLSDRNYNYSGEFRSIKNANLSFTEATLIWRDNWITLIDGMLQLNALQQSHNDVSQPTHIEQIYIDVKEHSNTHVINTNGNTVMKASVYNYNEFTRCGGVILQNIKFRNCPPISNDQQLKLYVAPSEFNNINKTNVQKDVRIKNETLQSVQIGELDSLHWVESPLSEQSNLTVKVHYVGLNKLDVKRATGVTSFDSNSFGMDYSGTLKSGERVMGIVRSGAVSTYVSALREMLWPVPEHWSLEDAATVPYAYAHAFYALIIKGRLQNGMSILVHGGVGALGQAVIAIALAYNCKVFATVSSIRKKQFLQKMFPQLKGEHIGNSRDIAFADNVLLATAGQGCDIVISCVKGELKNSSLRCCGFDGVLIDTVQIQDREEFEYRMQFMTRQRSYFAIDFSSMFTNGTYEDMKNLQKMLSVGIAAGYVVPLSRVTYAQHEVARAFRLLGTSQHRGRVLIRLCEKSTQVANRLICNPDQYQVMFWDNITFGVHLADRLVNRGARKLHIYCQNITAYLRLRISTWQQLGVKVILSTESLSKNKLQDVLNETIEGIYVVITEPTDKNMTDDLPSLLDSIDTTSRSLCPQLRYFAVVSTVKLFNEMVCLSRAKSGLPATYLDLSNLNREEITVGRNVAELTESAICCPHVMLQAYSEAIEALPLLKEIAKLAEISIPQNIDKDVTLKQLGMTDEKAQAINSILNNKYNLSLDEDIIPLLSVAVINDMQKLVKDMTPPNVKGLGTFFSYIGSDEILATADMVMLPTLFKDVKSLHNDYEIDERYLCIVPGMEGHHESFRTLCERLKLPALVLQPGLDYPYETVKETAQRYAKILMKKSKVQDNFYILGYESGVTVALELAAIFEKQGLTGTVFCLGCSPDGLQAIIKEELSDLKTKEQLQDAVLDHIFTLMTSEDPITLNKALEHATTWDEKVDTFVRCALGHTVHSSQYMRAFIVAALARVEQLQHYRPATLSLRSQLVLLCAESKHVLLEDNTLKLYSQSPIIAHKLQSNLSYLLNDMQCPSLINRYLDADTKEIFEKKNLCISMQIK